MSQQLDLFSETPISLADVPSHLPRKRGKKVHYSTVYRWITKGARGRVLESKLLGGQHYTTLEALNRFMGFEVAPVISDTVNDAIERLMQRS